MRLSQQEVEAIRNLILHEDPEADIYLYGSRTQDHLKGGDIDLLVLSDRLDFKNKINLLVSIQLKIGEQKIDLSIKAKDSLKSDAFVQSIFTGAIRLS
jgi:DNA polymerase sigma